MNTQNSYLASKPHYEILDGLRGVAALIVVAFHLFETHSDGDHLAQIINHAEELRKSLGRGKLMLAVDRLDYTKGIPMRLDAFNALLEDYPEYRGKVSLVMSWPS